MPQPTDLLQGTLDVLILRTLVQGPMHGWGVMHASSWYQRICCKSDRARFTPPCTGWNTKDGFNQRGDVRITTGGGSTIGSRLQARNS
jgi:hypothetical protein